MNFTAYEDRVYEVVRKSSGRIHRNDIANKIYHGCGDWDDKISQRSAVTRALKWMKQNNRHGLVQLYDNYWAYQPNGSGTAKDDADKIIEMKTSSSAGSISIAFDGRVLGRVVWDASNEVQFIPYISGSPNYYNPQEIDHVSEMLNKVRRNFLNWG